MSQFLQFRNTGGSAGCSCFKMSPGLQSSQGSGAGNPHLPKFTHMVVGRTHFLKAVDQRTPSVSCSLGHTVGQLTKWLFPSERASGRGRESTEDRSHSRLGTKRRSNISVNPKSSPQLRGTNYPRTGIPGDRDHYTALQRLLTTVYMLLSSSFYSFIFLIFLLLTLLQTYLYHDYWQKIIIIIPRNYNRNQASAEGAKKKLKEIDTEIPGQETRQHETETEVETETASSLALFSFPIYSSLWLLPPLHFKLPKWVLFLCNPSLTQPSPPSLFLAANMVNISSVSHTPHKWSLRCEIACRFQAKHMFVQSAVMIQFISIGLCWDAG